MTKQEQIEEMRRKIYYARSKMNGIATSNDIAEALYNAGYRKIKDETLEKQIKHLNTIVERLDELLGKGINEYIMGIDGVEGIKDMWERSAVREFAEKLKKCSYTDNCFTDVKWHRYVLVSDINELLREYE